MSRLLIVSQAGRIEERTKKSPGMFGLIYNLAHNHTIVKFIFIFNLEKVIKPGAAITSSYCEKLNIS